MKTLKTLSLIMVVAALTGSSAIARNQATNINNTHQATKSNQEECLFCGQLNDTKSFACSNCKAAFIKECYKCKKELDNASSLAKTNCKHIICKACKKDNNQCPVCILNCFICDQELNENNQSSTDCKHNLCTSCNKNSDECPVCLATTCFVCNEDLDEDNRAKTSCEHNFCKTCKKNNAACPTCKK